jgi:hypothetical protein
MLQSGVVQRFLHVTWLEVGPSTFYLVARCDLCDVVVEREISDHGDEGVLNAIGIELLGARCAHVRDVVAPRHAVG